MTSVLAPVACSVGRSSTRRFFTVQCGAVVTAASVRVARQVAAKGLRLSLRWTNCLRNVQLCCEKLWKMISVQGSRSNVGALLAQTAPTHLSGGVRTRQHLYRPCLEKKQPPTPHQEDASQMGVSASVGDSDRCRACGREIGKPESARGGRVIASEPVVIVGEWRRKKVPHHRFDSTTSTMR